MNDDGTCKEGFKKCGKAHGLSSGICLPLAHACPITQIDFSSVNPNPSVYEGKVTVPGENYNIYFTRKSIQQPLIDLNATESHMCLSSRKIAVTDGRKVYELYDKSQKSHCEKDTRFSEYDSQGEADIFMRNHVPY